MRLGFLVSAIFIAAISVAAISAQPNITLKEVNETARKNNQTTAVTTGEMTDAANQAEKEGKFRLAADYYGELIKKEPDEAKYYNTRGTIFLNNLKDYKAAVKDFEQVIKLNANEPAGFYNRGTAYINLSEWKKAKKDLDAALALNPRFVEALLNRGIASLNMKDNDGAIADFEAGMRINPRLANLYRARAIAYRQKGDPASAQADELKATQVERGQ